MYVPAYTRVGDPEILREVIRDHPFATLTTVRDGVPVATHLPFFLDGDVLVAHMARANPQWRDFDGREVLVVFSGPHAYISPRWYRSPQASVPTWNYVAVHAYGVPEVLDRAGTRDALDRLVAKEEARFPEPWRADEETVAGFIGAIVAFRIPIRRIEGKLKLSQNREGEDAVRVREALEGDAPEVARWMRRVQGG
jgi:transcriptional regulator